ncbi:MAG TPA: hypothetical protein VGN82_08060 [Bosea sp. (in: a-proteobacteria)]|jgi:hypothetical protein|uniref:hypothetical protein n=1 Tax=Bosea sp. (in: a-proteobacteria) TaxID=1871050 RepID=UPI002E11363F|nr:hypothetical protein [Bosea sp. (in: a-proteobacteria)]
MPSEATLQELDDRIALARRNISELMERATASVGAASEERISSLLSEQQAALDDLVKQRAALEAKGSA